jgi:pimeloyl-ACP methyl ester carboxylesterase
MKNLSFFLLLGFVSQISVVAQSRLNFSSSDGLAIYADHYFADISYPYILLFHQLESSRGEFREIAPRLNKLGYNCLAVDLRTGGEINFIRNETILNSPSGISSRRLLESKKDMEASIDFARSLSGKKVVLFGSSFSASLALILAAEREDVLAVVAFSPGEYFTGNPTVSSKLSQLTKPSFIAAARAERKIVLEMTRTIPPARKTVFFPSSAEGSHGAKSLFEQEKGNGDYWLALLMFFNSLKNVEVD